MLPHYPVQMRTFLKYHSKKFNLTTYKKNNRQFLQDVARTVAQISFFKKQWRSDGHSAMNYSDNALDKVKTAGEINSGFKTVNYLFRKVETFSFQVILYFLVL